MFVSAAMLPYCAFILNLDGLFTAGGQPPQGSRRGAAAAGLPVGGNVYLSINFRNANELKKSGNAGRYGKL